MTIPDDILRELRFQASRRSTLELEELLSRAVEEAIREMGEAAIAPLTRLLGLPDRTLEEILFKNKSFAEDIPESIRRILRRPAE